VVWVAHKYRGLHTDIEVIMELLEVRLYRVRYRVSYRLQVSELRRIFLQDNSPQIISKFDPDLDRFVR